MRRPLPAAIAIAALGLALAAPARAQDARREDDEKVEPAKPPTLTRPPRVIQAVAPEYPAAAAAAGREATVKVRITIDATGTVTAAAVVTPVGDGFDEAAVAAAEKYVFEPAEWDGVPGPITVETTLRFVLEKVEVPVRPPPPAAELPAGHAGDGGQPVNVSGQALERGVRRPLPGVIVSIAELGVDAVCDADGRFFFHGVPAGRYTLVALDAEFDRFKRGLEVVAGEAVEAKLYLRPRGGNPYETVVEGEREVLEVTRRTIERSQMTSVPGTFGDPIRVIQTLPGLARTPFSTGFLVIRGSNPDDSGVFIDGHRIPLLFHFLGGPSILNAELLDRIDLYPGGFPARFGRAHGGIVSVESRPGKPDGVHGSAKVDLLDSSGYVRAPIGEHGTLAVAGRRSYLDLMLSFFLPDQDPGTTLIVVPIYYDYQLRYDHDLGRHGKASLFVLGSSDILDVLSEDPAAEESFNLNSSIRFLRVIGSYKRPLWGPLELTLSPAWGRDSISFAAAPSDGAQAYTSAGITQDTLSYRMRVAGQILPRAYLDVGLDLESRVTKYAIRAPLDTGLQVDEGAELPVEELNRATDAFGYAAHADVALDLGPVRVIPGLRLDGFVLGGKRRHALDPRLTTRWTIDEHWLAKGYLGLFHQAPQPEALDQTFGNPKVGLEWAIHAGLGGEWRPTRHWLVDGEAYVIERHDLIEFTTRAERDPTSGDLRPINFLNSRSGETVGFELLVKREVTKNLYGWLSYTLSATTEDPASRDERPSTFDQRHNLNAVASYRTRNNWELGGRVRLSTGRPQTRVEGHSFDADEGGYDRVTGEFRGARAPTFHQEDVRVEKTWVFDTWMIGAYLDVQNLLNVENEEAVQYDYRFVERAPVSGVPLLPTLGVRGQW